MKYLTLIALLFSCLFYANPPKHKLIIFEGSDWCVNCLKLEKQVLNDTVFLSYLKTYNIQVEKVDFPQRKKQTKEVVAYNKELCKKYKFKGIFPTLIIVNLETKKFEELKTKKTQKLIKELNTITQKL